MKPQKEAKHLLRYAKRAWNYRKDILNDDDKTDLQTKMQALREARSAGDAEKLKTANKDLVKVLERVAPERKDDSWRETVEVLLVAIVIAVGVRTFILQPFKIPTGSMQPTLNGNIGTPLEEEPPNILQRGFERALFGRSYYDLVSPIDDQVRNLELVPALQIGGFTMGQKVRITTVNGREYTVGIDPNVLTDDFGVGPRTVLRAGQPFLRGYQTLGDHVFVDKVTYHFRKPQRDDIFVFSTDNIEAIEARHDNGDDGQHYIKRLVGLPGERLSIDPPMLMINGEVPQEPGMLRVMSQADEYPGYRFPNDSGDQAAGIPFAYRGARLDTVMKAAGDQMYYQITDEGYFGMGDNSPNSWDSRNWGEIPRENATGRGVFVWYPFGPHWGFVD